MAERIARVAVDLYASDAARRYTAVVRDKDLIALSDALREHRSPLARLCPDIGMPAAGGMRDLMLAMELADAVGDELTELNQVLRRTDSLEQAAGRSRDPATALAYLLAADRLIQVDDFG